MSYTEIRRDLEKRLGPNRVVVFGAFDAKDNLEDVVNNLHETAFKGKIEFIYDGHLEEPKDFKWKSPIVENPTWLDVCELANQLLLLLKDYEHIFLERIDPIRETDGVTTAAFHFGS